MVDDGSGGNEVPHYLICDRDGIYGAAVTRRLRAMGIRDKPIAIRRECLDHMIVFGEAHLRRIWEVCCLL